MTIGIVVADDHEVVRAGFAAILDTQPDFTVLGTAADGREAVRTCQERSPDVVLMDIRMPGMRMSIRTTSGWCSRQVRTASAPSAAVPSTVKSGWVSRIAANPARTTSWSSATTMPMVMTRSPLPLPSPRPVSWRAVRPRRRSLRPALAPCATTRRPPPRARACRAGRAPRVARPRP